MKFPLLAFTIPIEALLRIRDARSATYYLSERQRVTATRLFKADGRNTRESISVTYGSLNYAGRMFVRACKKAGEPFPVRKVQLRYWPKPRGKKKR